MVEFLLGFAACYGMAGGLMVLRMLGGPWQLSGDLSWLPAAMLLFCLWPLALDTDL